MKEKGQSIALLFPYSIPMYRKFGWEIISNKISYKIKDNQIYPSRRDLDKGQYEGRREADGRVGDGLGVHLALAEGEADDQHDHGEHRDRADGDVVYDVDRLFRRDDGEQIERHKTSFVVSAAQRQKKARPIGRAETVSLKPPVQVLSCPVQRV